MKNIPKISVIMSVYNGEKHLTETVTSILEQSFTDFEFIIVNDASTDSTGTILTNISSNDPRIQIITNKVNCERCFSRNLAITHARSNLIAVMDADDWAYPTRLEKQYTFMQEHPEVDVCGSALSVYSTGDIWLPPSENQYIRAQLLFNSCIYNPTVIFKKDKIFDYCQGYAEEYQTAQDYDLWARLSLHNDVIFANIPTPLLRYRTYPSELRANYYSRQKNNANKVRLYLLHNLLFSISNENFNTHLILSGVESFSCLKILKTCEEWAKKLITANIYTNTYHDEVLSKIIEQHWRTLCSKACQKDIRACFTYYKSDISPNKLAIAFHSLVMILYAFLTKIFPKGTRRRTLIKHVLIKFFR